MTEWTTALGHSQGANRHAAIQIPHRLEEYSTAATPGRFMEAFVEALALDALGCRHAVAAAPGRPSDPPGALLTLSREGDRDRLRSSRRLAWEPPRTVALRGLRKQLRPDHQPIAPCRGAGRERHSLA